jgi:lipoate-protein ligase A
MQKIHLLKLYKVPIFQQLQLEEALLRTDDRNWCLVNEGSSPAIVMGISCKTQEHINPQAMEKKTIPVFRRFSGGGTVIVDHETCFYTLIGHRDILDVPCYPKEISEWTERLYAPAFKGLQFALKDNDYTISNRKFGGNAQYICRNRWLHHSSLLWNYQKTMMDYLLMPPRTPEYRKGRSHHDFLCGLKEHFSNRQELSHSMISALSNRFEIIETSLNSTLEVLNRPHRKATIEIQKF